MQSFVGNSSAILHKINDTLSERLENTELGFFDIHRGLQWHSLASGDIVKIVMVLDKFSNGGKRH